MPANLHHHGNLFVKGGNLFSNTISAGADDEADFVQSIGTEINCANTAMKRNVASASAMSYRTPLGDGASFSSCRYRGQFRTSLSLICRPLPI
jgi:hypothetical protein